MLLLSSLATSAYLLPPRLVDRTCSAYGRSPSAQTAAHADCCGAAKFRRQWTDHLEEQSACTTGTRAVTERLRMCTEDAPVLDCPAPLKRFYVIQAPYTNA